MTLTLEELLSNNLSGMPAMPSNIVSFQAHAQYRTLEQELITPISTGHPVLHIGWEKVQDTGEGPYRYVVSFPRTRLLAARLRQMGARRDVNRKVWLLSLSKRDELKALIHRHRDLLSYMAEDEKDRQRESAPFLLGTRQERLEETNHRLSGLFKVAAFLRDYGRRAKVKEVASLDGKRSLHYVQNTELGHKDQVLAYDYALNRVWWCAGTHPDSLACYLPSEGASHMLTFLEQYHRDIAFSVKTPSDEQLEGWLSVHRQ